MNFTDLSPLYISQQGLSAVLSARKNALLSHGSLDVKNGLDVSIEDFFTPRPAMRTDRDGIAEIFVTGLLSRGGPAVDSKLFGDTDYGSLEQEIGDAISNPDVRGILLNVNSPGGSACGCGEISALVAQAASLKPVIAWTNGTMASAAYYIAASATLVYATESAVVGCIGTVMTFTDYSRMLAEAGIDVIQFASGPLKGAGTEGVPLTDEQKKFLQDFIDQNAASFKSDMLAARGDRGLDDSVMQGGWYLGSAAVGLGFVDAIATSVSARRDLLALAGISKNQ